MLWTLSQLLIAVSLLSTLLKGGTHEIPKGQILATSTVQAVVSSTFIQAMVTKYSGVESCHYPGCPTASGKKAYVGGAACPPKYPFGTKIKIGETIYTCEDRTATWVQQKNGPTFDIFAGYSQEAYQEAVKWGKQKMEVQILDEL